MGDFESKFDKLKKNLPGEAPASQNYETEGSGRNVCFIKADGNAIFFGYGYLVSSEHFKEDGTIILNFTSHVVTLKGIRMEGLYYAFMGHLPKMVVCIEERYNDTEAKLPLVNSIDVTKS